MDALPQYGTEIVEVGTAAESVAYHCYLVDIN